MNKNSVHDGAALLNGDRVSSTLAAIPYARHLGVRVAEFSEAGAVVFHLPFEERLVGNVTLPALHGGVIAAFMQVAALASTYSFLRGERLPKLVDFSLDYLSSAGPMDLYAVCDMHRVGKRIAAVGVRCWQQSPDNPVGVGRAHVFIAQSASDPNLQHVRSDQNSIAAHLATATGANSPLPTKAEDSK
ncbi:PaaI family thioesterase [Hydrogenophaga sp. D2P1]|jgi:uncharacterized protein (TIGR00369 family)|uniref:PaaI family thioesterase n=1 Tax=Hydrogenophaga aromaticivorans TaxID=2610898 RepID=A0A7Y8GUJ6_9BURK|nr:PaaI family thioesterase [Hydrogenophaga aromaticivorans]NWF45115.1 PaaI family thioesterase [Hydrogenophaga aromaticivorans]